MRRITEAAAIGIDPVDREAVDAAMNSHGKIFEEASVSMTPTALRTFRGFMPAFEMMKFCRKIKMEPEFRFPNSVERAIFDKLLENHFSGRNELREQLATATVRQIDDDGSLEVKVRLTLPAPVTQRVPVEGECPDLDGTTIRVLLHVVNGVASELEIYKDDSSTILRAPTASLLSTRSR